MLAELAAPPTLPGAGAELRLSPALQSYLRECVSDRLMEERRYASGEAQLPWFRIHLYLSLGDPASALAVDHDLREGCVPGGMGLIALFGQLAPGLDIHEAMCRQMHLMHGCDEALELLTPPSEKRWTRLNVGPCRYSVLTLHEQAERLHRVMPCPMLIFSPAD